MILIDLITKRLGLYRINPFNIASKNMMDHFKGICEEKTNTDYVMRSMSLNALIYHNRVNEKCANCEIRWMYYRQTLDSIFGNRMLNMIRELKENQK